jgi:hypothetical protein
VSAVDGEHRSSHEARRIRRQQQKGTIKVGELAESALRHSPNQCLTGFGWRMPKIEATLMIEPPFFDARMAFATAWAYG